MQAFVFVTYGEPSRRDKEDSLVVRFGDNVTHVPLGRCRGVKLDNDIRTVEIQQSEKIFQLELKRYGCLGFYYLRLVSKNSTLRVHKFDSRSFTVTVEP